MNWTVEVLPPRNFSQPGAPKKQKKKLNPFSLLFNLLNCYVPFAAIVAGESLLGVLAGDLLF